MSGEEGKDEINLRGQVTVPDPFPLLRNAFSAKVGERITTLHPDASGLCVSEESILLVKNASSSGVVTGGRMEFELTLRGSRWVQELGALGSVRDGAAVPGARISVSVQVGDGHHSATVPLRSAAR